MIFKALFGGSSGRAPANLPAIHGFVDVIVSGRPSRSVSVEAIEEKSLTTREMLGRAGERAVFVYATENGKYRFATRILRAGDGLTAFELPKQIESLGGAARSGGAQKRASVRLDTLVSGYWRLAPGGKGSGEFARANIRDISRGGCSLILDRAVRSGTTLEVRLQLQSDRPAVEVLGEVVRSETIPSSGRHSHGLRFHGVTPAQDQAIRDFIHRKQSDLRSRGLA